MEPCEAYSLYLITTLLPNVLLVKDGNYTLKQIVGAKEVLASGGEVKIVPVLHEFSTTGIIKIIKES